MAPPSSECYEGEPGAGAQGGASWHRARLQPKADPAHAHLPNTLHQPQLDTFGKRKLTRRAEGT